MVTCYAVPDTFLIRYRQTTNYVLWQWILYFIAISIYVTILISNWGTASPADQYVPTVCTEPTSCASGKGMSKKECYELGTHCLANYKCVRGNRAAVVLLDQITYVIFLLPIPDAEKNCLSIRVYVHKDKICNNFNFSTGQLKGGITHILTCNG